MKKLILVTNTILPDVELGVSLFLEKLKEKTGKEESYEMLYGRTDYPPRLMNRKVVIMLTPETFKVNFDYINPSAIGIILGDPLTLGCIKDKQVIKFDFRSKEDGNGFYLERKKPEDFIPLLKEAYFEKDVSQITTKVLEMIPNTLIPKILGSIKETTKFAQEFASLNYSVRNELDRDKIRRTLFKWIISNQSVSELETLLVAIVGKKKVTIERLLRTFDTNSKNKISPDIRKALSIVLRMTTEKVGNIPIAKIAEKYYVSEYDLRYVQSLARKDQLLLSDISSTLVHKNNARFRETGSFEEKVEENTGEQNESA